MRIRLFLVVFAFTTILNSCTSNKGKSSQVVLWELSEPKQLNPILATDINSYDLNNNIFQPLLNFDYRTLKLVPVLADSLPVVKVDSVGKMYITYEIRKNARWSNGTPVTAKDAEFTIKLVKTPSINDEALKTYYEKVSDVILYPQNPRKFTIVYGEKYMMAVIATGTDTYIMPEYAYDSAKVLEPYSVKQLSSDKSLATDPKLIAYGKQFNDEKYSRAPKYVTGSGAYKLASWTTGQEVVLDKKSDWWGDSMKGQNCFFEANPGKLIYRVIGDFTSAVVALKAGNIDAIDYIKPSDFDELKKSDKFTQSFNMYNPLRLSFTFIGLNMSNPKFADIRTRQAIAHLFDVNRISKDIFYGYAQPITCPLSPMDSLDYDFSLKPYDLNLDTAKALLAAAGWKDGDGNGVLEKNINGKKTEFTIDYVFNAGNELRKKIGLLFKEEARKVGIEVNIIPQENGVYTDNLHSHKFEMCMSVWGFQPGPMDFKQMFYSGEARNGGENYPCFGNAASDTLIDSIRCELDPMKRAAMTKRFERMAHDECGYIFLCAQQATIAINKRYSNAYSSSNTPYYWEAGFDAGNGK